MRLNDFLDSRESVAMAGMANGDVGILKGVPSGDVSPGAVDVFWHNAWRGCVVVRTANGLTSIQRGPNPRNGVSPMPKGTHWDITAYGRLRVVPLAAEFPVFEE